MFHELVRQVQRLFSSKKNAGKLVNVSTDRLHYYKQVILATSIVLLLGYSQFRNHFHCMGLDPGLDVNGLTIFCWTNGSTTLDTMFRQTQNNESPVIGNPQRPHAGIEFKLNDKQVLINHNYMRSMWSLLILMAVCSFVAQRRWASIFQQDILRALLKLPDCESLEQVKQAQMAQPYKILTQLPSKKITHTSDPFHAIELLAGQDNAHNHTLDFYLNQLICLLLAWPTCAYKISGLKLRRKLVKYHLTSSLLTLMQFLLPLMFIGHHYKLYGLEFLKVWLRYTLEQLMRPNSVVNSVDYELSARIWPTLTSCRYQQYGYVSGLDAFDGVTVSCTASINEICGKLFVVIWWFVAINGIVEFYALVLILICSFNFQTVSWGFGLRYWPHAKSQAKSIATFRYKRALRHHNRIISRQSALQVRVEGDRNNESGDDVKLELSEFERKELEATGKRASESSASFCQKKWYLWCSRDVGLFLADQSKRLGEKPARALKIGSGRSMSSKDDEGFREIKEDLEMYYLFYLLYLRLDRSQKKIERIIRMTSAALESYLDNLDQLDGSLDVSSEVWNQQDRTNNSQDAKERHQQLQNVVSDASV